MTRSLGKLYKDLDSTSSPIIPTLFCLGLRKLYPQFDEKDSKHQHKQQDSDEFLSELISSIKIKLSKDVEEIFGIEMSETMTCDEEYDSNIESKIVGDVDDNKLNPKGIQSLRLTCFIDEKINFLTDGIQRSMEDTIEKRSVKLGEMLYLNVDD